MNYIELFIYFLISPIFEWTVHLLLHKTENALHNQHHEVVYKNKYEKFNKLQKIELWPLFCIYGCYYCNYFLLLITFLRYWIAHTYIHFSDNKNNYLVKHHYTHHKYKNYNLCVSATWPDYLFNTKYRKIKAKD